MSAGARFVGRFAWVGLLCVGCAVVALGIWSRRETLLGTAQARRTVIIATDWTRLRRWLVEEETRERKFRIELDPADRPYHGEAVIAVRVLAERLSAESPAADAPAIARLERANERYGRAMRRLFDAAAKRDAARVEAVHDAIDPTYDAMEATARTFDERYERAEYVKLADLENTQERATRILRNLSVLVGLAVVAGIAVVIRYGRRSNAIVRQTIAGLEAAAQIDALTGLGNHRAFRTALEAPERAPDVRRHLAIIDVDTFKSINDRFGHARGDAVLRSVGDLLGAVSNARAFRIGGDEFAVIFASGSTPTVRAALEGVRISSRARAEWTLSIGLAAMERGESVDAAYERADAALYAAKNGGRDRVVVRDAPPVVVPPSVVPSAVMSPGSTSPIVASQVALSPHDAPPSTADYAMRSSSRSVPAPRVS